MEVCCCLGSAAQLPGVDVAGLVKLIREAVQTVRRNKEDCALLAERADLILDLLRRVQQSNVIEDPGMWKPTEGLRSSLHRALALVGSCQERSYAYLLWRGGHIANELRKVLSDLEFYVAHLTALITIINHDQITRYFLIQQPADDVQLQEGAQATVGLPVHHTIEHNDRGYVAPEYKRGGYLSLKTDVYSFGATLLEIIRGSRIPPSTLELSDESRDFGPLNKWAWDLWREGNLMEFIDPSLHGETHAAADIQRWVQIALLCVQHSPEERPDMWDVVLMLSSDIVILPKPNRPAYY
ncbi:hypothetical protein E2562_019747 [Oryza meyeriana var. granulata]|uniref:Uncharacterized protein n=1 Tax=Oryza meyeriana var. granulata TaxID=110450 RepID=A0A6G1C6J0_9ORYZ|nr:hypothetical protein E2562_019747 [Oryza meyeriana var. granulata]